MPEEKTLEDELSKREKGCDYSLHRISRFIQPCLLLFLSKEPSYGYSLIENLKEMGFHEESIDVGAVYRALRRLEKENFVESSWESTSNSKRKRRCYVITSRGKAFLKTWVQRITERKIALENFLNIYFETEGRLQGTSFDK